jgi:integrase
MPAKRFDRYFGGVRITRPSGVDLEEYRTSKKAKREFDYRDGLLTRLWDRGQKDTILAFARGDLSIEDIVTADRLNRLNGLASDIATLKPLWSTWEELIPKLRTDKGRPISAASQANYLYSMKRLRALNLLPENALISDLEAVDWTRPYQAWDASPAAWNHLGRALSRFLTVVLGDKFHPLRRRLARDFPRMDEHPRMPSLTVSQFNRVLDMLPPHYQAPFVVLAITGMRLGELVALQSSDLDTSPHAVTMGDKVVRVYGINIRDSKTAAGVRKIYVSEEFWHYVTETVPLSISHWYLRDLWSAAVDRAFPNQDMDLRIHDLRHFTAQSLSNAGVPEAQIQAQLGHADPNMTRMYSMQTARAEVAVRIASALSAIQTPTSGAAG